ncbi:MAG: hypothetical protein O7I93_17140, partial [Gemmatimonadetes bacterium]|nr:hypothetical protein [Gemmatimonadota bacterium]
MRGSRLFEAVDRGDVRVVERREHFGFALEPRQALRVSSELRRQHLHRHLAFQLRVGGPIHLPHPAHADLGGDLLRADAGAGGQRHAVQSCGGILYPPLCLGHPSDMYSNAIETTRALAG